MQKAPPEVSKASSARAEPRSDLEVRLLSPTSFSVFLPLGTGLTKENTSAFARSDPWKRPKAAKAPSGFAGFLSERGLVFGHGRAQLWSLAGAGDQPGPRFPELRGPMWCPSRAKPFWWDLGQ